jgi:hypothetical protein
MQYYVATDQQTKKIRENYNTKAMWPVKMSLSWRIRCAGYGRGLSTESLSENTKWKDVTFEGGYY